MTVSPKRIAVSLRSSQSRQHFGEWHQSITRHASSAKAARKSAMPAPVSLEVVTTSGCAAVW